MTSRSLALALLFLLPSTASSQESSDKRDRWEFDVTYEKLRPLLLPNPVESGNSKVYWYLPLKVTNNTGAPRPLSISGHLLTAVKSQPKVLPALAPETKEPLQLKLGKKLTNILEASGTLADKESIDLVVVFADLSPLADKMTVRLSGLASCVYSVGSTNWKEVKDLAITFHRLGDEFEVTGKPIRDLGQEWVVVSKTKVAK